MNRSSPKIELITAVMICRCESLIGSCQRDESVFITSGYKTKWQFITNIKQTPLGREVWTRYRFITAFIQSFWGEMTFYCRTYYVRAACCDPLVLSPPRIFHKKKKKNLGSRAVMILAISLKHLRLGEF